MSDITVGLVADPGLPQKTAESLINDLQHQLENRFGPQPGWNVEIGSAKLPLNSEGEIPFLSLAKRMKTEKEWDYFIYLTDLPRLTQEAPMLCEIDYSTDAALISLPTLGAVRTKSSVQKLVLILVRLMKNKQTPEETRLPKDQGLGKVCFQFRRDSDHVAYITTPGTWNRLRLLAGTCAAIVRGGWYRHSQAPWLPRRRQELSAFSTPPSGVWLTHCRHSGSYSSAFLPSRPSAAGSSSTTVYGTAQPNIQLPGTLPGTTHQRSSRCCSA